MDFGHSKLMLFVPSPPRQRKSRGPGNGGAPVALRILAPRYDGTSLGTQNGAKAGHRGQKVVPRELNIVATGPKHLKNGVMGCQNGPTMTKNNTPLGPWAPADWRHRTDLSRIVAFQDVRLQGSQINILDRLTQNFIQQISIKVSGLF